MPDVDLWTPEDDVRVRQALESLRLDVDRLTIADPATVRKHTPAAPHRGLLIWSAGLAAAAIAIAAVGLGALARDRATPALPPATSSNPAPSSTTPSMTPSLPTRSTSGTPAPSRSSSTPLEQFDIFGPSGRTAERALFVPPSEFSTLKFAGSRDLTTGLGEPDGSPAVTSCDSDTDQGGTFGYYRVRFAPSGPYIASHRVRVLATASDARSYQADLLSVLAAGCTFDNGITSGVVSPSGRTAVLTTEFADLSDPFVEYVGVARLASAPAVATLVMAARDDLDASVALAELERLLDIAETR